MKSNKIELYRYADLLWDIKDANVDRIPIALCPNCRCRLTKSKETYSRGEFKYHCIKCDFKITLERSIENTGFDLSIILESLHYKDADIINIDGELIKVNREEVKDTDYWIDVKTSKNKKGELQLMVLAGSRKGKDKTQLFLEPKNERLAFDQNNDHPQHIFAKVVAVFKNSKSEIHSKGKE